MHAPGSKESDIIFGVLSLIDISLTGNLILIVAFSGREKFVSKIDPGGLPDCPTAPSGVFSTSPCPYGRVSARPPSAR